MRKAIYECFENYWDCSYHYTDTVSMFININVALDSTVETEMNKMIDILHNSELGKMKDEIPNDTIMEACFLTAEAYCCTSVEEEEEKEGITKATVINHVLIEDYTKAVCEVKSKCVINYTLDSNKHHLETIELYKIANEQFDDKGEENLMVNLISIIIKLFFVVVTS